MPFISNFLRSKGQLGQNLPSFFKIRELEIDALAYPLHTGGQNFENQKETIKIQNLSFAYQNTEQKVINSISLVIPRGKMTTFVGASGSGKSTLAALLWASIKLKKVI